MPEIMNSPVSCGRIADGLRERRVLYREDLLPMAASGECGFPDPGD